MGFEGSGNKDFKKDQSQMTPVICQGKASPGARALECERTRGFRLEKLGRRAPVVPKLRRGSGCPRAGVFEGVATPSNGSMEGRAREGWGGGPLSLRSHRADFADF